MMKKNDTELKNQLCELSVRVEKTRDLSVLLGDYFNEENFVRLRQMKKEGHFKNREDELVTELLIYKRNFEEYGTLMFDIIEKLRAIEEDIEKIAEEL